MATVKYLDENGLSTVWSKVKGIVTPKADKVSGATNGHLAGLNSSGNLTDSGLVATNVAQKDGSYSGMTVGAAEDLVSAESVASEFTSRITGGSTAVGKGGTALVDKIKGRTLVINQIASNGDFSSETGWGIPVGGSLSYGPNGLSITFATRSTYSTQNYRSIIANHKYYFSVVYNQPSSGATTIVVRDSVSGTGNFIAVSSTSYGSFIRERRIGTANITGNHEIRIINAIEGSNTTIIKHIELVDLTLMFGAGNEPATPEEFEALYPLPYYDYNLGTLISNAATAIETVGWNAFDNSTLQSGKYRNVSNTETTIAGRRCSDEYFPCIGGANYNLSTDSTLDSTFLIVVCWYDSAKQFISGYNCNHAVIAFPSNAAYFRISSAEAAGNICISLADPSRNGTYEPYWRSELELGLGDIKVKSHNIWDEEWENGEYDTTTGAKAGSTYVRTKHYIPVESSTSYYFYKGNNFSNIRVFEYDANQAYIQNTYKNNTSGFILTTASNTKYVTFYTWTDTSYANNICINLSDPAYNGRYEPYGDGGVISLTGGLKSAGTVYDEISGGKLVKRIESVDMGSLTWNRESTYGRFLAPVDEIRPAISNSVPSNIVCAKYKLIDLSTMLANQPDKTLAGTATNTNVCILDSAYSDAATFQASLAGVPLYYELAQPIEYELAEAIPTAMRNDPYGTERRLPEDTAAIVTAPFRADITYSTNIKEAVQSLPQNYINVNSMQDFLAALGEQMGGTWTMRPADGKFDFTFTPNPVEPTL